MTGCRFAALIASDQSRLLSVAFPETAEAADVNSVFETGGKAKLPAVALFTSQAQLVEQVALLAAHDRWKITEVFPDGVETDDIFVGVDWRVREGLVSSVMGFGPFSTMPITRRAPYACIAAWPGEHDNKFWTRFDEGIVHFLDTDLSQVGITKARYQTLTKSSVDATKEFLNEPPDDPRYYRRAAFRLSSSARGLLHPVLKK
jgi:hypothetical protein